MSCLSTMGHILQFKAHGTLDGRPAKCRAGFGLEGNTAHVFYKTTADRYGYLEWSIPPSRGAWVMKDPDGWHGGRDVLWRMVSDVGFESRVSKSRLPFGDF